MHVSVFDPASPRAARLLSLWNVCIWVCGFILAAVTLSILYIVVCYRRRDDHESSQVAGNGKFEVTGTAIPSGLAGLLFVPGITAARPIDRPISREPDIVLSGQQRWWAVEYPAATTANEMHVRAGRETLIGIEAADVVDDIWVPQLAENMDAIPVHPSDIRITADRLRSTYLGARSEFRVNGTATRWGRVNRLNTLMRFAIAFPITFAIDGLTSRSNGHGSTLNRNPTWRFCP